MAISYLLRIPLRMLHSTRCDGLMIGRGSLINPFIFHQIRAHFSGVCYLPKWEDLVNYFETYLAAMPKEMPAKLQNSKLKQLLSFIFKSNAKLLEKRQVFLSTLCPNPHDLLNVAKSLLKPDWEFWPCSHDHRD